MTMNKESDSLGFDPPSMVVVSNMSTMFSVVFNMVVDMVDVGFFASFGKTKLLVSPTKKKFTVLIYRRDDYTHFTKDGRHGRHRSNRSRLNALFHLSIYIELEFFLTTMSTTISLLYKEMVDNGSQKHTKQNKRYQIV